MRGGLPWRSAPVQKARPAPVIIPTQSVSSWSNRSQIPAISRLVALSMQLSFGCRSMVTWTTRSSGNDTRKCLDWRGPERKDMASRSAECEAMPGLVLCDARRAPPPAVLCLFISDRHWGGDRHMGGGIGCVFTAQLHPHLRGRTLPVVGHARPPRYPPSAKVGQQLGIREKTAGAALSLL